MCQNSMSSSHTALILIDKTALRHDSLNVITLLTFTSTNWVIAERSSEVAAKSPAADYWSLKACSYEFCLSYSNFVLYLYLVKMSLEALSPVPRAHRDLRWIEMCSRTQCWISTAPSWQHEIYSLSLIQCLWH